MSEDERRPTACQRICGGWERADYPPLVLKVWPDGTTGLAFLVDGVVRYALPGSGTTADDVPGAPDFVCRIDRSGRVLSMQPREQGR